MPRGAFEARSSSGRYGYGRVLIGVAIFAAAGAALYVLAAPYAKPAPGHNPFHVNCPPGSHGQSWSANHGKSFLAGRRQSTAEDAQRSRERP